MSIVVGDDQTGTSLPGTLHNVKMTVESGEEIQHMRINPASSSTVSQVASSASAVTLQAANALRKALIVFNDSTQILYLKFGSAASATSYTVKMVAGAYYEMPTTAVYTGIVTGIWASANGYAYVTEY
jgi:hypothetical protein